MTKLEKAVCIAAANTGRSVIRLNAGFMIDVQGKSEDFLTFGVKNTDALPAQLIDRLRNHRDFLWLTVDKMSDLGRSVDIDLVNPLTYRLMTGSTSGGCVNILKGINDICIGTDGGGSILAPALSTNLFSFMGQGCGLSLDVKGRSTDGLKFTPAAGIIASTYEYLLKASKVLCDFDFGAKRAKRTRIIVPEPGCLILPDGNDSTEKMRFALDNMAGEYDLNEFWFSSPYDRTVTTQELSSIFESDKADIVLSWEGPIDVFSYDETIPRSFGGSAVSEVAGHYGKALLKCANICGCSALTVPGGDLASGFVIICAAGFDNASAAFELAKKLSSWHSRPEMFEYYFVRHEKYSAGSAMK